MQWCPLLDSPLFNFAGLPIALASGGKSYPSSFSQYQSTRILPFESFIKVGPQLRVPDEGRKELSPWAAVSSMTATSHGIKDIFQEKYLEIQSRICRSTMSFLC